MKKPFPYYRRVQYTDDGCTEYQCLACKVTWEARHYPSTYCGGCGIKFDGLIESREHGEHDYDRYPRPAVKKSARWVIEARRIVERHPDACIEWTGICDLVGQSAKYVVAELRRYRAAEELSLFKTKIEFDGQFGFIGRVEFRAVLSNDDQYLYRPSWVLF